MRRVRQPLIALWPGVEPKRGGRWGARLTAHPPTARQEPLGRGPVQHIIAHGAYRLYTDSIDSLLPGTEGACHA
jgi:hypothetical protein